jgi:methylated-DNA-protein-cysteine methyltransferase-like protein
MLLFDKETFIQAVYDIVKRIPAGRATSYGMIAKAVGHPNYSRMVGKVMKESGNSAVKLPAHRVVNSSGKLSGKEYFDDSREMQQLLEAEGITVINNQIKNWKNVSWDPIKEISLDEFE